jgi:predicted nucleic acid-binding protein
VVGAFAVVPGVLNAGPARFALASEPLHAPHLVDAAVASARCRLAASGLVTSEQASEALATWQHLGMLRHPVVGLLNWSGRFAKCSRPMTRATSPWPRHWDVAF